MRWPVGRKCWPTSLESVTRLIDDEWEQGDRRWNLIARAVEPEITERTKYLCPVSYPRHSHRGWRVLSDIAYLSRILYFIRNFLNFLNYLNVTAVISYCTKGPIYNPIWWTQTEHFLKSSQRHLCPCIVWCYVYGHTFIFFRLSSFILYNYLHAFEIGSRNSHSSRHNVCQNTLKIILSYIILAQNRSQYVCF